MGMGMGMGNNKGHNKDDGKDDRTAPDSGVRIRHFFDEPTGRLTYVVHDGRAGIVFDPVRDDEPGRRSSSASVRARHSRTSGEARAKSASSWRR